MIRWAISHVVWFVIRCAVTLACLYTLQHVMVDEGYRVENKSLLMVAVVFVIGVKTWTWVPGKEEKTETTWSAQ